MPRNISIQYHRQRKDLSLRKESKDKKTKLLSCPKWVRKKQGILVPCLYDLLEHMLKKRAPYDKKQNYIVETKAVSNTKSGPPIVAIPRKGGGFEKSGAPEICDDQPHKISNVKAWDTLPINGDFMQKVAILSQILAIF